MQHVIRLSYWIFSRKPPQKNTPTTVQYLKRGMGVFLKSHIFALVEGLFIKDPSYWTMVEIVVLSQNHDVTLPMTTYVIKQNVLTITR